MKFLKTTLFLSFAFALAPLITLAAPGIPHQFYGTVTYTDGSSISSGTVKAKISGVVVGSSVTANGKYGYNPNLLFVTDNQGVNAGKTVEFYVDGIKANETKTFANGESTNLNLTIPASLPTTPPTPSPTPTGGGVGGSTSGGGGGVTTPSTPTSPLSAAAKKVDANKDNKVDVLDFVSLMANWGKTGSSVTADFNNDGKVDVLDFVMLMVNWTK